MLQDTHFVLFEKMSMSSKITKLEQILTHHIIALHLVSLDAFNGYVLSSVHIETAKYFSKLAFANAFPQSLFQ